MPQTVFADDDKGVRFSFWLEGDEQANYRIAAFKAEEKLFSLTKIEVLLKISSNLNFTDCLGKKAGLTIESDSLSKPAYLCGIVAEATEFFEAGDVLTRLVLLPSLAKLEREPHYRVFQELTIPDIVETLLCEHGISDALWQLEGNFTPRRFCMQYGESDLAFMHRVLAEEGVFYYFVYEEKGRERPVFCNNIKLLLDCPNGGGLRHDDRSERNAQFPGESASAGARGAASEVYCHSLRRSFGLNTPINEEEKGRSAARLFRLGENPRASSISGIAHLPLPLCGHKVSLSCPYDKSLNGIWSLIAVRHEGIGADGGLLSRDLADYFDEDMAVAQPVRAENVAASGAYGRAFGATSLLPRLMQANGGWVYDAYDMGSASPYGVPYQSGHNIVSLNGRGAARDTKPRDEGRNREQSGTMRQAIYACAFTGLDGKADYHPPKSLRPVIAGPQEAQLIQTDKAARRYKLALRINGERQADAENDGDSEVRFWAYADTELGAAVEKAVSFYQAANAADGLNEKKETQEAGRGGSPDREAKSFLLEFLGGNPDKPIIVSSYPALRQMPAAPVYGQASPAQNNGNSAEIKARAEEAASAPPPNIVSDGLQSYSGDENQSGANGAGGSEFIRVEPRAYNAFNGFDGGLAGWRAEMQAREQSGQLSQKSIPLAQMQAELSSGAAHNVPLPPQRDEGKFSGSRFLQVAEHQREDINGIYELNCGKKYLCRTKAVHINAGDRLILRGPGGRIIIDKYSMILEAPTIRLKGRLCVEEDIFDRQEGVKTAIRDELPLVSGCDAPAAVSGKSVAAQGRAGAPRHNPLAPEPPFADMNMPPRRRGN